MRGLLAGSPVGSPSVGSPGYPPPPLRRPLGPPWLSWTCLVILALLGTLEYSHAAPQNTSGVTKAAYLGQRGTLKFADPCTETSQCGFYGALCDPKQKTCRCIPDLPATNHIDKCGKAMAMNESCDFDEQCDQNVNFVECKEGRCACCCERVLQYKVGSEGDMVCVAPDQPLPQLPQVDPTMIGVLVGMGLMFVTLCVVMRLFSQARWRENRTIFNTPNPRLMNASLLKQDKHEKERRGSRGSVRGPSRQPSMASLRPHSPGASQGQHEHTATNNKGSRHGSRPDSAGSSNASATSTKSLKSPTLLTANNSVQTPILESVTVEVQDQDDDPVRI